jgi:hypothetical protein
MALFSPGLASCCPSFHLQGLIGLGNDAGLALATAALVGYQHAAEAHATTVTAVPAFLLASHLCLLVPFLQTAPSNTSKAIADAARNRDQAYSFGLARAIATGLGGLINETLTRSLVLALTDAYKQVSVLPHSNNC